MNARRRIDKQKLVIVANRLPVRRSGHGAQRRWVLSPGGLVRALTPVLRTREGVWVGWWGSVGRAPEPFDHDGIHHLPVGLNRREFEQFYEGFSNRTIWPLYHDAVRWPEFRREWWSAYVAVNERFAAAVERVAARGATIWVHDYHLQLVPGMLRAARPDLRIGFFLHIPFPPQELFSQLPWRQQILEGLMGANAVGFQTRVGAQNFIQLARHYTPAARSRTGLTVDGRTVVAGDFPISIDHRQFEAVAADPEVRAKAADTRRRLGNRRIVLGVDRLDYTKGIHRRLRAFDELLTEGNGISAANCVMVQVAVPSREEVLHYAQEKRRVEETVGLVNGKHGQVGRSAVQYLHRSLDMKDLVALYLAADVMLVTPFRDGMNLVAKEFVATRLDDTGVLILSEFTGAAHQLKRALLVNPHDLDGMRGTLRRALTMPERDVKRRMRALRAVVRRQDVYEWANQFLDALET